MTDTMTIDNFDEMKILKELESYSDIYEYAQAKMEENDAHWGTDLNESKLAKLNYLKDMSKEIHDREPDINFKWMPLSNESRHGMVQLRTDLMGFMTADKRVLNNLAAMFSAADMVNMNVAVEGGEEIIISFCVENMWNNNGTKETK